MNTVLHRGGMPKWLQYYMGGGLSGPPYTGISILQTQYHLLPSSTKLYWPSITMYQPASPHTDQAQPCTNQNRPIVTKHYNVPASTAPHWPSTTSTNQYRLIITQYQPLPLHADLVPPSTNQYCFLLTHYHHVSTSATLYWQGKQLNAMLACKKWS